MIYNYYNISKEVIYIKIIIMLLCITLINLIPTKAKAINVPYYIYSKYGISFIDDKLYYNNQPVKTFVDNNELSYVNDRGIVNLEAVRNDTGGLEGIRVLDMQSSNLKSEAISSSAISDSSNYNNLQKTYDLDKVYDSDDLIAFDTLPNISFDGAYYIGNPLKAEGVSIKGAYEIFNISCDEDISLNMKCKINMKSGDLKLVLIYSDGTVTTLTENNTDNDLILNLKSGMNKLKLVGKNNSLAEEVDIKIDNIYQISSYTEKPVYGVDNSKIY